MSLLAFSEWTMDPVGHAVNHPFTQTADGIWIWSTQLGTLILAGLITIGLGLWLARNVATGPESLGNDRYITRNVFAHMIEVIAVYLRDEIIEPMLGPRTPKFIGFLWTLFFFILVNNLLGLIPVLDLIHLSNGHWRSNHISPLGGTATQNLAVTMVLAIISGVVINVAGFTNLGVKGYFQHMTGGVPMKPAFMPIIVMVFVIEVAGNLLIKPAALGIRLFANMTAGHILLATLFSFVILGLKQGLVVGVPVGIASVLGAIAVYFLELFVAFLQAFVFMFLTTVFISLLSHNEEHAHEPAGAM